MGPTPRTCKATFMPLISCTATCAIAHFHRGMPLPRQPVVAVLWIMTPRATNAVSRCLATVVLSGMLVDNFHWLSDMLAGAFLGASIGWMTGTKRREQE